MGTLTSWTNPLDDMNWSNVVEVERRSLLKSPRMMVGTIWGRLEMNSSMSDKNVAIGCCGRLYTVMMHIV